MSFVDKRYALLFTCDPRRSHVDSIWAARGQHGISLPPTTHHLPPTTHHPFPPLDTDFYKKILELFAITKILSTFAFAFADMAQLVEQRIRNAWVPGSSPGIGSEGKSLSPFFLCGISTSVVHGLPKPGRRVRFPYPALFVYQIWDKQCIPFRTPYILLKAATSPAVI